MSIDERRPLLEASNELQDSRRGADPDQSYDAHDPKLWPAAYKWVIIALLASMSFVVTFNCTAIVPVANHIVRDLDKDSSSRSGSVLLVTIWELGEAAGPFFLAPLSETFGRYPVVNTANLLFILATVLAALCQSTPVFIGARALTGLAVVTNVLNPAIVGDLMVPEQRGFAMSMIAMAPLLGNAVGPAIGSVIAERLGWRQVIWGSVAMASVCELLILVCLRETCYMVIQRRLPRGLGNASPAAALLPRHDNRNVGGVWESVLRPVLILYGSGVLMIMCLFSGVAFAFAYIFFVTLPDILEVVYKQPLAVQGSAFLSYTIGLALSVMLCNRTLDRLYIKLSKSNNGVGQPEFRLPLAVTGALLLPPCVVLYGYVAQLRLPIAILLLSSALLGAATMLSTLPIMAYVVDAFGSYPASAMAGLIFVRSLAATFLPLVAGPLITRYGYARGFGVLSASCLSVAPVPILVLLYGPRWRQRSKYSRDA